MYVKGRHRVLTTEGTTTITTLKTKRVRKSKIKNECCHVSSADFFLLCDQRNKLVFTLTLFQVKVTKEGWWSGKGASHFDPAVEAAQQERTRREPEISREKISLSRLTRRFKTGRRWRPSQRTLGSSPSGASSSLPVSVSPPQVTFP